jgi:hypothetical protein
MIGQSQTPTVLAALEFLAEPSAVVSAIGNQVIGGRQGVEHETSALWSLIWAHR